ncbi:MAG: Aspartyl/glutamyl-tRNA(Asn/Gln) amidotransferase subunit B [candidate division BRC1 bacterium ADurb.BinA364]|nr:MAG: Aspartyl/glutamyl-tRNA(Asn/Gln) amidotransferase subunit B [candidate division BRC1 bacterium ADurb.BinA364]
MEVHVELATESKCFCGCSTRFGAPPNTQVCPVCLGLPGSLPVLNERALECTLLTALALNCRINRTSQFERKNYYYPDLPKNYQISQLRSNFGVNGWLDIPLARGAKRIGIDNVHLEEDAGKLAHPEFEAAGYSLIDLNRAGTPLIEIVSDPDMRSTEEAMAYMQTLRNLLLYLGVSDCKMQEGRLRFECNISVRPEGSDELRTKVEIKNLNSMRTAIRTIEYEARRQAKLYDQGETVAQETRLWDEAAGVTRAMRGKEHAHDYRYFPEPDLPALAISDETLDAARRSLPEMADAKRARFREEYGLPEYDAAILTASKSLADYYEDAVRAHNNPKAISNWMMTELVRELAARELDAADCLARPAHLAALVKMIDDGAISGSAGKTVFAAMIESGRDPQAIVDEKGLAQVSDADEIDSWIEAAIAGNAQASADFAAGKDKALSALVGAVMKASRGKANPQMASERLRQRLRGA